ncbi:MFS transporter [Arenibaculum pallidiluteum]|uniref:MFS transporter n=1 Tax=Arenibaculum pallidiluteum TaxID=2812559 RepID=UPI001A978F9E|nr:MFS transporter [Arenibaculum pallidiluteum]
MPRTVLCLGIGLLVSWGVSYYLIGVFGDRIAADLGWRLPLVHGGFTAALLTMAVVSGAAGRLIDRHGGRWVMAAGAALTAIGCIGLASSSSVVPYYASWICLGVSMRLTLYDAAFASLARIGGAEARGAMAQVTLFGGLSSTVFWPVGDMLAEWLGWRGAVLVYGGLSLASVPLFLGIPGAGREPAHAQDRPGGAGPPPGDTSAGVLYALAFALAHFLSSALSAHLIGLLAGLGIAGSAAVWIGTLRGIGQVAGRFCQVLFGARIHPADLNALAMLVLPVAFAVGLLGGGHVAFAALFVLVYGAGHGVLTITQGTLPLVLFDHGTYGARVGRLLVPGFVLSAVAPLAFAVVIERLGERGALYLCLVLAGMTLACALVLRLRAGRRSGTAVEDAPS